MLSKGSFVKGGGNSDARPIWWQRQHWTVLYQTQGRTNFENDVVWEIPLFLRASMARIGVTVTDISHRNFDAWHYTWCSERFKCSCTQHGSPTRNCYAVDLQFVDRTSLLETKMFMQVADELFSAAGVDPEPKRIGLYVVIHVFVEVEVWTYPHTHTEIQANILRYIFRF